MISVIGADFQFSRMGPGPRNFYERGGGDWKKLEKFVPKWTLLELKLLFLVNIATSPDSCYTNTWVTTTEINYSLSVRTLVAVLLNWNRLKLAIRTLCLNIDESTGRCRTNTNVQPFNSNQYRSLIVSPSLDWTISFKQRLLDTV